MGKWNDQKIELLRMHYKNRTSIADMEKIFGICDRSIRYIAKKYNIKRDRYIKIIDLSGKIFGHWTVISYNNSSKKNARWFCKCNLCDKIESVLAYNLKNGASKQCRSCSNPPKFATGLTATHWYKICQYAAKRKIKILITREFAFNLFNKQNGKCSLSGVQITLPKKWIDIEHGNYSASLDRIDSTKDYSIGNVQWVHRDINFMKNVFSQDYFIEMCKKVSILQQTRENE